LNKKKRIKTKGRRTGFLGVGSVREVKIVNIPKGPGW